MTDQWPPCNDVGGERTRADGTQREHECQSCVRGRGIETVVIRERGQTGTIVEGGKALARQPEGWNGAPDGRVT